MRTALYQINSKYIHSSLAAWYLAAAIKDSGCECTVLEGCINESEDCLFDRAVSSGADVIAFCCYIWNINTVISLAKRLKEHDSTLTVILGGPEVGYRAQEVLSEYAFAEYVICGEGEVPLAALICSLERGEDVPDIDGICSRETIRKPYVMNTDPPCPYCEEYLSTLNGRIAYIETSRGCPFSCAYCLSSVEGVRFFDIERAKSDIITLARSGTKTVKFVDRTFNADKKRAMKLFSFIISKRAEGEIADGVTFHFEIAGELLDRETLDILKDAPVGLFQFEIGVQSFNSDTLRAIHRYTDLNKLSQVIRELYSYANIHIHTDLIAGLPYEDMASFRQSYNTLVSLGTHKLQLGFLKLLYGSDMYTHPQQYPCEYDKTPPYKVRSTPWLTEEDLNELETVEKANDEILYSKRFRKTVEYLMSATGMDAYSLCLDLGGALFCDHTLPLDELTDNLYRYCSILDGVRADVLRDRMLYDRISTNSSCVIPSSLRISDPRLKALAKKLSVLYPQRKGVRRCIGILYSEGRVIFADYDKKHPVTGCYDVFEYDMNGEVDEI